MWKIVVEEVFLERFYPGDMVDQERYPNNGIWEW